MLFPRPLALFALSLAFLIPHPTWAGSAADSVNVPVDPRFFDYDPGPPVDAVVTQQPDMDGLRVYRVTFPSPVVTPFAADNTVIGFFFQPPGPGPYPAMVVLHEWLPVTLANEDQMCEAIAHAGTAAFLMEEPFSLERRPVPHRPDAELLSGNLPQMVAGLRQTVIDARRSVDYLQSRPDIDPRRLGVGGISLGGVLAPLVAGADGRPTVVLTVVAGSDVADTIWNSVFTRGIRQGLRERGYTFDDLRTQMAPFEAGRWLHDFDPQNALMFNGRDDFFIRPWAADDMARALGGAHITWLNTGHYGVAFTEQDVEAAGAQFLRARFSQPPVAYSAPDNLPARTIKLGILLGGQEKASPALAYQVLNFDAEGRYSLDGQLTLAGVSAALSARLNDSREIGIEFPLFHSAIRPTPFLLFHVVL